MKAPMRLAILGSRGIPARYGGFETFAEQLSVRLVKLGVDVTVFCESAGTGPMPDYQGVHRYAVRPLPPPPFGAVWYDLVSLLKCAGRFDVVYMLGYGTGAFCEIPRLAGAAVWVNMDGAEARRASWGSVARAWFRVMRHATARGRFLLIADSSEIRDLLRAEYSPAPECRVISYGADVVPSDPGTVAPSLFGLPPDGYYLMVSRLVPENNVLDLVDAFQYAPTSKPLLLIGDFRKDTEYARRLKRRISERILMAGPVYHPEIMHSLRYHAYGYLHGHSVGGTNPSLLEAMGCGCAVVALDNPFNREAAGDSAIYIPKTADLPVALATLENSNGMRRRLGDRARARVAQRFSWDDVAARYLKLLKETVDGKVTPKVPAFSLGKAHPIDLL